MSLSASSRAAFGLDPIAVATSRDAVLARDVRRLISVLVPRHISVAVAMTTGDPPHSVRVNVRTSAQPNPGGA